VISDEDLILSIKELARLPQDVIAAVIVRAYLRHLPILAPMAEMTTQDDLEIYHLSGDMRDHLVRWIRPVFVTYARMRSAETAVIDAYLEGAHFAGPASHMGPLEIAVPAFPKNLDWLLTRRSRF
jgi:hypothetical protein